MDIDKVCTAADTKGVTCGTYGYFGDSLLQLNEAIKNNKRMELKQVLGEDASFRYKCYLTVPFNLFYPA